MSQWRRWHFLLVVAALWAPTYLLGLGWCEIKSEEAKRIMPAQTMLATGHWQAWVLPSIGGDPYYKKPPGINWLIAASFAATGSQSEFAARLPSALLLGLLAGLMTALPCPFLNPRAQFLGAVIFLSSAGMLEKGRLVEIDGPLTALTGLAVVWWLYRYADHPRSWATWLPAAVFLVAGTMLKGPFLAAAAAPVILLTLIYRRRLKDLVCPACLFSIALILVLGLGWVLLAGRQTNAASMTQTWSSQIATRVSPWKFQGGGLWVREVLRALALMLPFILMVPLLWMNSFVRLIPPAAQPYFRALRWGSAAGFVLLGMMPGAMARYALPVLPGVALALGAVLEVHSQVLWTDRLWRIAVVAGFIGAAVVAMFGLVVMEFTYPEAIFVSGVAFIAVLVVAGFRSLLSGGAALTLATGVLMCLLVLELTVLCHPLRRTTETRRPLGAAITQRVGGDTLEIYHPGYAPFLYYVRCPKRVVATGQTLDPQAQCVLLAGRDPEQPETMKRLLGQGFELTYKIALPEGTWQLLQRTPGPSLGSAGPHQD